MRSAGRAAIVMLLLFIVLSFLNLFFFDWLTGNVQWLEGTAFKKRDG
jgi:hypothetical protein